MLAEKRRKVLQERRATREQRIEESIGIWEKEILPDWRVVHKNAALRKLWWKGIPSKLRAPMWERAVGNALALNKGMLAFSQGTHQLRPISPSAVISDSIVTPTFQTITAFALLARGEPFRRVDFLSLV